MKLKNRHRLKSQDINKIQNLILKDFNIKLLDNKSSVDIGKNEDITFILIDDKPVLMQLDKRYFFTLHGLNLYKPQNKYVVVDAGAIKHISNGADVMAPGIVDADKNIEEGDQVWVCDQNHHKPLAVGIACTSGEDMINSNNGKSVSTVHYVGDKIWNLVAKSL